MGRRSQKRPAFDGPATIAREKLERAWHKRMEREPFLLNWVTNRRADLEPYHRWMHYRQGYSPQLVRAFLKEYLPPDVEPGEVCVLDPFSGSGTCVLECARLGVNAVGVEALPALAFATDIACHCDWTEMPLLGNLKSEEELAGELAEPSHRAALLYATAAVHTAEGRLNKGAPPLHEALAETAAMIAEDLLHPLKVRNAVCCGDARKLPLADASISAMLTSPPYLSRYDYSRSTAPLERLFARWTTAEPGTTQRAKKQQLAAHAGSRYRTSDDTQHHPAAREAAVELADLGEPRLADAVLAHFAELDAWIQEAARVLLPEAPAWVVIGGARPKNVYVPSDLIFADLAQDAGFEVEKIRVARDLVTPRRSFGRIGHVAPRESLVVMTRRA